MIPGDIRLIRNMLATQAGRQGMRTANIAVKMVIVVHVRAKEMKKKMNRRLRACVWR